MDAVPTVRLPENVPPTFAAKAAVEAEYVVTVGAVAVTFVSVTPGPDPCAVPVLGPLKTSSLLLLTLAVMPEERPPRTPLAFKAAAIDAAVVPAPFEPITYEPAAVVPVAPKLIVPVYVVPVAAFALVSVCVLAAAVLRSLVEFTVIWLLATGLVADGVGPVIVNCPFVNAADRPELPKTPLPALPGLTPFRIAAAWMPVVPAANDVL